MPDGSWFVYRSPFQGPSGVRVRRLPDRTPLAWFQRMWELTADPVVDGAGLEPIGLVARLVDAELGDRVDGLYPFFDTSHDCPPLPDDERRRPLPATTWRGLEALLDRSGLTVRMDQHSIRIWDPDEDDDAAFYFLDDDLARTAPHRLAYLLREDWRLPPLEEVDAAPGGAGTTWVVMPGPGGDRPLTQVTFPGVRVPGLAGHLRALLPGRAAADRARPSDRDGPAAWPEELLLLRAMTRPGDRTLGPALRRYDRCAWRLQSQWSFKWLRRSNSVDHATAAARVTQLLRSPLLRNRPEPPQPEAPPRSPIDVAEHLVQALIHRPGASTYRRWYLFDDVWASAHPDLAASLLRYADGWDPLAA